MTEDPAQRLWDIIREIVRGELRAILAEARPVPPTVGAYLSTRQAAELAGVSQGTIRRWIREGRLHVRGAGRELRVERLEIETLLNAPRRGGSGEERNPEAEALAELAARSSRNRPNTRRS